VFFTPNDLTVNNVWVHTCTSYFTRGEVREWLEFTDGCKSLLDAGSSAGFFSAIFNNTTGGTGSILSVEPDSRSFQLLQETIRLNGENEKWRSANCALSDKVGQLGFVSSGFGGNLSSSSPTIQITSDTDSGQNDPVQAEVVRVETLDSVCSKFKFLPDLIKMDIESYEFEALGSSLGFLKEKRPKLFLELHNEKPRERGLAPEHLIESLLGVGHKCSGSKRLDALCAPTTVHLRLTPL